MINKTNNNSGDLNSGDCNSGNNNSGDSNTGDLNSGNRNSGIRNSGDWNSGDWNTGHWNSGIRNSGNWNSGNWNSGHLNSGHLNTNAPKLRIFNKETAIKKEDIIYPDYFYFNFIQWIEVCDMSAEEKKEFYWYKTTNGYLRTITYKDAWKKSFDKANKKDVKKTLNLPNFDYKLFKDISGITKKDIERKLK